MNEQGLKGKEKPEEIVRAEQLIDKNKLDEAFILLNNYEQKEGNTHHDKVSCHLLQSQILSWQWKYKELLKYAEQAYKESEVLENSLHKVDSLLFMVQALINLDKIDEAFDLIIQGEKLITTIPQELTKAHKQREAHLAFLKAFFYNSINDADLSLECLEHSLTLREELEIRHEIAESLALMAFTLSYYKGELDRALKYAEQSYTFAKESKKIYYIAFSLSVIAMIHSLKGDLDQSILFFEQCLEYSKQLNNKLGISNVLNNLSTSYMMRGE